MNISEHTYLFFLTDMSAQRVCTQWPKLGGANVALATPHLKYGGAKI
jgi:hypothetical protein